MVGLDNPLHILIILVVVLLVFGAKRLPEMGKGLGEGMRGFKSAIGGESPEPPTQVSLTPIEERATAAPGAAQRATAAPVATEAERTEREPAAPVA